MNPRRCGCGLAFVVMLHVGATDARAETDRSSAYQFRYEETLKAIGADGPRSFALHRAPPTFRRILMQRAADPRAAGDRRPRLPSAQDQKRQTSVAVYGDRFGQALGAGLADGGGPIAVTSSTSDDAGLCRPDFNDWLQSIRTRLARPDRPDIAVMMLGSNDREPLPDGTAVVNPRSPRWAVLYGSRVDAIATAFHEARVPLIWVGLPSVHSEEISADFVQLNGIVRDRTAQDNAIYVDSWEAFNDESGRYSPVGPDVDGQTVKLRKGEGFGFTRAGARKLASFIDADLKRLRASPGLPATEANIAVPTTGDFDTALQIDVNAQIRREAGLAPEAAPTAVDPASVKPAAGPVIPLTAPPLSANGELAGAAKASLETAAEGPAPKPGRADDFAWPRN